MKEEWKEDARYPGYMFSNTGKVVSFKRDKFIELKQTKRKGPYWSVGLWINNRAILRGTAKLLAEVFGISNSQGSGQVMFKDGNPDNLHISNIIYCTKEEIEKSLYDKRKERFIKENVS